MKRIISLFIFIIVNHLYANDLNPSLNDVVVESTEVLSSVGSVNQVNSEPFCCPEVLTENYGSDPRYIYSLKNYPTPRKGCIAESSISTEEADELIRSQNFRTENATQKERRVLAAAIKRVQQLNGGVLEVGKGKIPGGFPWQYRDSNGSVQYHDHIEIGRNIAAKGENHHGHSVAQQLHEWAHLIGNQGAYPQFQAFMKSGSEYSDKDYCMVSNYADNTTGEQFAEVFAAFASEPRILLNNSRTPENCKKVFRFFWQWFNKGEQVQTCL
ncbi:MAG: hypothetical protein CME62_14465 [Halobacteriovoraceae bacterium]|nr:hypothetical protein [Halobacteriovoraceae bacterium]